MKEMIKMYEKGTNDRIEDIPIRIIPPHTPWDDAEKMVEEYWKEHGSRKEWEARRVIDPEVYL